MTPSALDSALAPDSMILDVTGPEGSIAPVAGSAPPSPEDKSFRRRLFFARSIGVVGILVTLSVAGLAFGPGLLQRARAQGWIDAAPTSAPQSPAQAPVTPPPLATLEPPPEKTIDQQPAPALTVTPTAPLTAPLATPSAAAPAVTAPIEQSAAATAPSEPSATSAPSATSTPRATPARRHVERPLTPSEIEARKWRYERWLREEGLKRIE